MECPICYDLIETTRNCITTECGHQFHAKCLMKNAHINGFSCPSCRAQMVDVKSMDSDSDHIYLGDDDEDNGDDMRRRRRELSNEVQQRQMWDEAHDMWDEAHMRSDEEHLIRNNEFIRSEEEEFQRAEEELLRIREERQRCAELERQREQIEIQNDIIDSLYEYQEGESSDEKYYDNENDQQNGEPPTIEYISEQLMSRGVTVEKLVSAMLRTNSAYYKSILEHDRINAVITKDICEIVFEYIMRPQHT